MWLQKKYLSLKSSSISIRRGPSSGRLTTMTSNLYMAIDVKPTCKGMLSGRYLYANHSHEGSTNSTHSLHFRVKPRGATYLTMRRFSKERLNEFFDTDLELLQRHRINRWATGVPIGQFVGRTGVQQMLDPLKRKKLP